MRIKEIKIQKGHLYSITMEDGSTRQIDRDIAERYCLKAGKELTEESADEIYAASQLHRAKSRCLWYLERRDYSAKELADKLYGKFESEYIKIAVERMTELGLINDEAYATRKAERMIKEQGMSMRLAKQKLMQKGLGREQIEQALEGVEYDGIAAAKALIDKKYASKISNDNDLRHTYQALLRRGFSHSDIKGALKEIKEDLEFEE